MSGYVRAMMGHSSLVEDFEKSLKSVHNSVRQFWGVGKSVRHLFHFSKSEQVFQNVF